ncbi:MAG: magnesium/cobalt transporter CorA [Phycisphaerales bacterium]|nr:magnesium/cobalt transporter CorA [Phycisphaerales bacterium]MCI0675756.1 magnesium/cobalt transporter CorA [Phycisphaerales bacterium]
MSRPSRSKPVAEVRSQKTAIWTVDRPAPLYEPPGTLSVSPSAPRPSIRVIAYGPDKVIDQPIDDPRDIAKGLHRLPVTWVNVDGLGDVETIRALGEIFGLHKLALEDVVHVGQRPKVDEFDQCLYIVARMIDRHDGKLDTEQLSMFLGPDYVITFQERPGDCLDAIRLRIKEGRGRIRQAGADYLSYCILDAVIDDYFPVLESVGDKLERLEDETLENPQPSCAAGVHLIKRDLLLLRRAMWPLREAVSSLQRGTSPLIKDETRLYFRDCYDHTVQVLDLVEVYRELCTSLIEMYMTSISHRMNQIIKVLTIISTIFIPLTFIAGVYGMNFENQPEFGWKWAYPVVLAVMAAIGLGMLFMFWKRGWLRREEAFSTTDSRDSNSRD